VGNFSTAAIWDPIIETTLPSQNQTNAITKNDKYVLQAAKALINETVTLFVQNEIKSVHTYNVTNIFVREFETLLTGKEINPLEPNLF
jgi:hypothetical protein